MSSDSQAFQLFGSDLSKGEKNFGDVVKEFTKVEGGEPAKVLERLTRLKQEYEGLMHLIYIQYPYTKP